MRPIFALVITLGLGAVSPAFSQGPACVQIDYKLGYIFKPGCLMRMPKPDGGFVPYTLNKVGLRDKDYSPKPAPGTYRILFMGPSTVVNLDDDTGVVAGFRKELTRAWTREKRSPLKRKFRKVEVIAAGEAGYHLVQSSIRLPMLLEAYQPHLVVFSDFFAGSDLQLIFEHHVAEGRDPETGLVTALGNYPRFWPFPESWSYRFWQKKWGSQAHVYSVALRMALLKFRLRFSPKSFCGKDDGGDCVVSLYQRYLSSMRDRARSSGAELLVLWQDPLLVSQVRKSGKEIRAWYKPAWVAGKLSPWETVRPEHERAYKEFMQGGAVPGVEIGEEYWSSRRESSKMIPGEYHLEGGVATRYGASISRKVFDTIQEWFRKPGKKKSR